MSTEKDPKQFIGTTPPDDTYPGQKSAQQIEPLAIDLLPQIFRTETNKKIFAAMIEDMFQPSAIENVNFSVGRPNSVGGVQQNFLPRQGSRRQFESGLFVEDSAGQRLLTADDIALAQEFNDNHLAEDPIPVSVMDLPINPDKFINWSDYYWLEQGMPTIYLTGSPSAEDPEISIEQDVLGKQFYTFPQQTNCRRLELKNGMRIVFQKNYSGRGSINGDSNEQHIADGSDQLDFSHEMTQYNKGLMTVQVNGVEQIQDQDYTFTLGSIKWLSTPPAAGSTVDIDLPDYWTSYGDTESESQPRPDTRWQVEGVGSPSGIRLLPLTMQMTDTVYSGTLQGRWDPITIPWDRALWDGDVTGVNKKHYVLMAPSTENRCAHSRVNVWVHRDTIKTACDFLDRSFDDFASDDRVALRPILEFESNLELYNHGHYFRHWVDCVVDKNISDPWDLMGASATEFLVWVMFGTVLNTLDVSTNTRLFDRVIQALDEEDTDSLGEIAESFDKNRILGYETIFSCLAQLQYLKQGKIEAIQRRVLWLSDGEYKNKIITFKTNSTNNVIEILVESAKPMEATTVMPRGGFYSLMEYHWNEQGQALPAQTRLTAIQEPLFCVYDRNQIALDKWKDQVGFKSTILNSTIIELIKDSTADIDSESGYRLSFTPTQFKQLEKNHPSTFAMYDVQYQYTLQNAAVYLDAELEEKPVPGPYNFRRLKSPMTLAEQPLAEGLSLGYRRAWFRLRSWVKYTRSLEELPQDEGSTIVSMPVSAWPEYCWRISYRAGQAEVQHLDNHQRTVDNLLFAAIGEPVILDTDGITTVDLVDSDTDSIVVSATADDQGIIKFNLPADIKGKVYQLRLNDSLGSILNVIVMDPRVDPRSPEIKLNGMPVDYQLVPARDTDGKLTGLSLIVDSTAGLLEIAHQGQFETDLDHCTAIPGLELNPTQNLNLGTITPARMILGMNKSLRANQLNNTDIWPLSLRYPSLDGCLMADASAMRGLWAKYRLNPTISEVAAARSMSAWRWYRKFTFLLEKYNRENDLSAEPTRIALDKILEKMTVGINYSVPDAVSGMVLTTGSMNLVEYTADGAQDTFDINTGDEILYLGAYGPDHVYVYVNDQLQVLGQYSILDSKIKFLSPLAEGTNLKIYHSPESFVYCGMPASPAKLGLGGLHRPRIVRETWENYDRLLIIRHDGSSMRTYQLNTYAEPDPRDSLILELENRIYNACVNRVGELDRQRLVNWFPDAPMSAERAQAQLDWFANNDIDYRSRIDYDSDNPWTWNYGGKSWRAIYLQEFGTTQPHSAPWEMMGYDEKPTWWSTHYSWIDPVKRQSLEQALYEGLISEPGQPKTYDARMRRRHALGFPVDQFALLLSPFEWGLMAPSPEQARQPWELGSLGPAEEVWLRSSAGSWARLMDDLGDQRYYAQVMESGIQPFVTHHIPNCPFARGEISQGPSNFRQSRPTIGIGALLFEANREINLLGESPLKELALIQVILQFGMGGFSDNSVRFRMYHARYQNGNYVPDEDFALTINPGVAVNQLRYSAVRLEKDATGFRVYGYDPYKRYFLVASPIKQGPSGSSSGTYQTIFNTGVGDFVEYQKWNLDPVSVPYGHLFADKQQLFDFFMGLNEYQKSQGLIFDNLGLQGQSNDWKKSAVDAFVWIEENWSENHYVVLSPASTPEGFKFYHKDGYLDRLDSDLMRKGKILLSNGYFAQNTDLMITREVEKNTDYIQLLNDYQILFADFQLRKYDHVYFFNSFTRFGDLIIDSQANLRLDYLDLVGRRTRAWTGRPYAVGLIPERQGLIPGFETLVDDLVKARQPEKSQFNVFLGNLSKSNAVPLKTTVLDEIIRDPSVQFSYRQGLQTAAGTNLAIDAFFRHKGFDIPGRTQDLNINEQWLFRDGEFGYLGGRKIWEIELRRSDMTSDRQIIRFLDSQNSRDSRSDNIIDLIGTRDPRWISRSLKNNDFAMIPRENITPELTASQGWLPSAGVVNLINADLKAKDISTLISTTVFDSPKINRLLEIRSFSHYSNYLPGDRVWYEGALYQCLSTIIGGADNTWNIDQWAVYDDEPALNPLPNVWISDYRFSDGEDDVFGWNVLQFTGPMYVEESCPNALDSGLNESKVTFANPHHLSEGDIFLMTGSGDGNYDRFHRVLKKVDDYNVLIGQRSSGDVVVYNLVAFRLITTKFKSLTKLESQLNPVAFEEMQAYVEPDSGPDNEIYRSPSEGEYRVYRRFFGSWIEDERYSSAGRSMVDGRAIEKVLLLDKETEQVLASLEIYDPYKGLVFDQVGQYINHRQSVDPAIYNIDDLGLEDLDATNHWGSERLNQIWWDTSRVRYIEYEQGDLQYRAANWGKQFEDSQIAIYEWVRSESKPDLRTVPNARLDYSSGIGVVRYSEIDEEDPITGAITTYYYYWQRGIDVLPEKSTRKYSAQEIETMLENPDISGVSWFSPIYGPGSNLDPYAQYSALIVSNVGRFLSSRSSVILRIIQKFNPEQQHENGILVSEGFTGSVIPEYLYRRFKVSVAGRDQYRKCNNIEFWEPNTAYAKGTYIINQDYSDIVFGLVDYGPRDFPILAHLDGGRENAIGALVPINEITGDPLVDKLHHVFMVRENGYVSSDDFQQDFLVDEWLVLSGTSALIKDDLREGYYKAVSVVSYPVPDLRLHPLRRYGNQYSGYPKSWYQDLAEARRNLVTTANAYLLTFDAVNKPNWDNHLRIYRSLIGNFSRDLTRYWSYADYVHPDYQYGSEQAMITSLSEIDSLAEEIVIFGLLDEQGVLQKTYRRSGANILLLYQRDGTIQFNSNLWDGQIVGWDSKRYDKEFWDEAWDLDLAEVLEMFVTALREDLFVDEHLGYFNLTFFEMVKESLRQIPNTDWVFKTTYLDINQRSNNDLKPVSLYYDRKDTQVQQYIQEVKPYHTKVFSTNQQLVSDIDMQTGFEEKMVITVMSTVDALATSQDGTFILADPKDEIMVVSDPTLPRVTRQIIREADY